MSTLNKLLVAVVGYLLFLTAAPAGFEILQALVIALIFVLGAFACALGFFIIKNAIMKIFRGRESISDKMERINSGYSSEEEEVIFTQVHH